MPLLRSTFFFKDTAGAGWSETYYNVAVNLTAMNPIAQRLVPKRIAVLGLESGLYYVRMSDDLVKRDSQIIVVEGGGNKPLRGASSNLGSDDVVVRIEGANLVGPPFTVRRTLALRGAPVSITGAAGVFVGEPTWNRAFTSFANQLQSDGWAIRYRDRTVVTFDISGAVQAQPTGIVTVTTALTTGFRPSDTVIISRVFGAREINGGWTVLATPTLNSFTIQLNQIMTPYSGGGNVHLQAFALARMNLVVPIRCSTHKAGRVFDSLRGRRRVRARR